MPVRKILTAAIFFSLFSFLCFSQQNKDIIEFYAVTSSSSDREMIKLTQNLLFSYINDLDGYTVIDKRDEEFSPDSGPGEGNYAFYASIQNSPDGWMCTLSLYSNRTGDVQTAGKAYENYSLILLELRTSVSALFDLVKAREQQQEQPVPKADPAQTKNLPYRPAAIPSTESLAGTWKGEKNIEKIVIMRGGRGFVIFSNGASMNLDITIKNGVLYASQKGSSNASFYPDLPRQVALAVAQTAPPIEWRMELSDDSKILFGQKTTLEAVYDGDTVVSTQTTVVPVVWERQ